MATAVLVPQTAVNPPRANKAIHHRLQKTTDASKDVWASVDGVMPVPLDPRFAEIKKRLVKPENYDAVQKSWDRLLVALQRRTEEIEKAGPNAVPTVDFASIQDDGTFPPDIASRIRAAGCCVVRGVVPSAEAQKWKSDLLKYTEAHPDVASLPKPFKAIYATFWQPVQVASRSHPSVIRAQRAMSQLYHASEGTEVDLVEQALYADRWRVRRPGMEGMALPPHLDNGSIERWEDPEYSAVFRKIWEGKWEEYDAWDMDHRAEAVVDLYGGPGACSAFRSVQGWLSIDDNGPGCGTIQLLPSVQLSTAYILLRPFFDSNNVLDMESTYFYGADPGQGQVVKDVWHPHLELARTVVSCPPAAPGDYVFWHCDMVHQVETEHSGTGDSSVIYIPVVPLCAYNVGNLVAQRSAFLEGVPPPDMPPKEGDGLEKNHADRGGPKDVLSVEGKRLMGLDPFVVDEEGITRGQKAVRRLANEALGF